MEKKQEKQKPIFYDPTHRRLFILTAIVLSLFLIWLYLKLFDPMVLFRFSAYTVRPVRMRFVRIMNRVMLTLLGLHYLKLLLYLLLPI